MTYHERPPFQDNFGLVDIANLIDPSFKQTATKVESQINDATQTIDYIRQHKVELAAIGFAIVMLACLTALFIYRAK